jgi:hypothetical protein
MEFFVWTATNGAPGDTLTASLATTYRGKNLAQEAFEALP